MKEVALVATLFVGACSGGGRPGEVFDRVPVKVAGVTYQWPYDGSSEVGDPAKWTSHAFMPRRLWNETVGTIASQKLSRDDGYFPISLSPAEAPAWNIKPDGTGLPLSTGEKFVTLEDRGSYILGEVRGKSIVSPSTTAIWRGEADAYAQCRKPDGGPNPRGYCVLLMNDRGVRHTFTFGWGEWGDIPGMLLLYRHTIGVLNSPS